MQRRRVLTLGGAIVGMGVSGCLGGADPPDSPSPEETPVSVVSRAEQPTAPVDFDAEMAESPAAADRPARVRVTVSNPSDSPVTLGEARAVRFQHVSSADARLYLHPADDSTWEALVDPGCWRLSEHVAVPEYYGTISLDAGEAVHSESHVLGHPDLPEAECLPDGDHRVVIDGVAGEGEDGLEDGVDFEWGFTVWAGA